MVRVACLLSRYEGANFDALKKTKNEQKVPLSPKTRISLERLLLVESE